MPSFSSPPSQERNKTPTSSSHDLRLLRNSPSVLITVGTPSPSTTSPTTTTTSSATWHLPLNLLTNVSPFFSACLSPSSSFLESTTHKINLPEDDPEIFDLFVQWLFTGKFLNPDPRNIWTEKAWVLGDRLGVGAFRDEAMRVLWREYSPVGSLSLDTLMLEEESGDHGDDDDVGGGNGGGDKEAQGKDLVRGGGGDGGSCNLFPPTVKYVYENTPRGSKLRAFVRDMVIENIHLLDLDDDADEGCLGREGELSWAELLEEGGDFVVDVVSVLKKNPARFLVGKPELEEEESGGELGAEDEEEEGEEGGKRIADMGCPAKPMEYYLEAGGET